MRHYPEGASQAFKTGEVLIQGAAGVENTVVRAADAPVAAIVGIALADASGTTGTSIPVAIAKPTAEFVGYIDGTDPVDFTDLGAPRAIELDDTNDIWTIETDNASEDAIVPLRYLNVTTRTPLTSEGGTEALVVFRFMGSVTVWGEDGIA